MLLTIPWLGSILLGRVDIINGQGRDGVAAKFTLKSFIKQVWAHLSTGYGFDD